jgi:hypothetical protein
VKLNFIFIRQGYMSDLIIAIVWVLAAGALGFAVSAVFAGIIRMPRMSYLLVYIPISALFIGVFFFTENIHVGSLILHNWIWGLIVTMICAAVVIKNVTAQPSSPRRSGSGVIIDILWPGLAYGVIDGILLSVVPALAILEALSDIPPAAGIWGQIGVRLIALAASCLVAAAYHLGYPEFRGRRVLWPILGNGLISVAYLVTLNPLAAVIPHAVMHVAAIIHGRDTTLQLPPHYGFSSDEGMEFKKSR